MSNNAVQQNEKSGVVACLGLFVEEGMLCLDLGQNLF